MTSLEERRAFLRDRLADANAIPDLTSRESAKRLALSVNLLGVELALAVPHLRRRKARP